MGTNKYKLLNYYSITKMIPTIKPYIIAVLLSILPFSVFSDIEIRVPMKLRACPNSPNCVSSQSSSSSHLITPLHYNSSTEEAMQRIKKTILAFPRTKLVAETDQYLHVEFKSLVFRFVDDVEILINDAEKVIHLRSASRIGYSDLGANRRRVEEIKKKFVD